MTMDKIMPRKPADKLILVTTDRQLKNAAAELTAQAEVAFDLEADSMYHFEEKICLIQAATPAFCYVIDPLVLSDLSPLAEIFSDPDICKIFHKADYDIRILYKCCGMTIENLFDTELASRFLGRTETGLEAVLKNRFNVHLEKKFQKKDWSRRPLPPDMIAYAANDVRYLILLYRRQKVELDEKGRLEWVDEECRRLAAIRPQENDHLPMFTRLKGAGRLEPRSLAVLENLLAFRNQIARQKDRPPFKVMGNAALLKIAQAGPKNLKQLHQNNVLSDTQVRMYGPAILGAVKQATAIPDEKLLPYPHRPRSFPSRDTSGKLTRLKDWRQSTAGFLEIEPGVFFNNALLKAIAEQDPKSPAELDQIPGMKEWQKKYFGNRIIEVLKS